MKIKYCVLLLSVVVLGSVKSMENPDNKYVEKSLALLKSNGALLKNFLTVDKYGYCSKHIDEAAICLQKSFMSIDGSLYNQKTKENALLVMNRPEDRKELLGFLRIEDFEEAKRIIQNNPYVLYRYKEDKRFDEINKVFIKGFITRESQSSPYRAFIKNLLHEGFDLDTCDEQGVPLLSQMIRWNDGSDKYLDLLKAGARVNIEDANGNNALFYAATVPNKTMVSNLLLHGAVVKKSLCDNLSLNYSIRDLLLNEYEKQKCCVCNTHDQLDKRLSNIPCVNRHIGVNNHRGEDITFFICKDCYNYRCNRICADDNGNKKVEKKCPVCSRTMGELGA